MQGSYQIVYQQCTAEFVGIAIFSPKELEKSMVGVINFDYTSRGVCLLCSR